MKKRRSITNPFYPEIIEAIERTANERDYQTLFSNTHLNFEVGRKQMEWMMSRWVDVSIIGLDDIMLSAYLRPPLTTVAVPKIQLAREATSLLFKQIDGEKDGANTSLVAPYLIIRESTARPPEQADDW